MLICGTRSPGRYNPIAIARAIVADPRILVMGSGDAYGDAARYGVPLSEEMPLRPVSP